ncbi:MAG TPA: hypothetical protein VEQ10_20260 [Vicinamibacteria bacterium]|nr:hypothetical protein [Vicinamibacteria bacterium]
MTRSTQRTLTRVGRVALASAAVAVMAPSLHAAAPAGLSFYSLSPCRVIDTRKAAGPTGGPSIAANTSRDFPILGSCAVPTTALAVVFNVTVVAPTDFGDLRIYPAGTTMPLASVINWVTSDFAVANGAIIPVGSSSGNHVSVRVDMPNGSTGKVDVILDVTGYFQ